MPKLRLAGILALLAAGAARAQAPASPETPHPPVALRIAPVLQPAPDTTDGGGFASAETVRGRVDDEATLEGNAEIRRGGMVVRADRLTYHQVDDEVVAVGRARFAREGVIVTAPEMRLRLDSGVGAMESPRFAIPQFGGQGRADRLELLGGGRMRLLDAFYTTCRPDRPDWYLHADRLDIDDTNEEGEGRGATIRFKDVPIVASPYLWFPTGEGRRSGFLSPTFTASSRVGLALATPYYWDIAPNRDLLLTPRLMARRGLKLGADFRYLEPGYSGRANAEYLPSDAEAGRDRWLLAYDHTFRNLAGWTAGWTLRGVSDDRYFADFGRSILASSQRSLPRDVWASRTFGDWSVTTRYTTFQNILEARNSPPYERTPQLAARWALSDPGLLEASTVFDASHFERPLDNTARGWRGVAAPVVAMPLRSASGFVIPALRVHASRYDLAQTPGQVPELSRTLPTFSLDSGLVFERDVSFDDRAFVQTLEPRLFYVRTPYRDQSQFPVFDTAVADLSFAQLFSTNTFVGNDRIADANHLTSAVTSRLIDASTGRERVRFAVGQRWYFTPQRVTLPGQEAPTDDRSDVLVAGGVTLATGLTLDAGAQYAIDDSRLPRYNATVRWLPQEGGRVVNLSRRYIDNAIDQVDLSWQWPLSPRWATLGRLNYSLKGFQNSVVLPGQSVVTTQFASAGLVEALFGIERREDCWAWRVVLQQYVTSATTRTQAITFQLELTGLTSLGSYPSAILRRSIPGYTMPGADLSMPGRYIGYE